MALSDDFNAYTGGNTLDSESADWDVWVASGTGVMTLDQHDDHSDLSQVVDMSGVGDNWAIHQTQVGGNDHYAEADVFLDSLTDASTGVSAQSGPIVRGNSSSMGSGTFDGYAAFYEREQQGVGNDPTVVLRIYRIDNDSATLLASSADVAGEAYDASTTTATVRLEVNGDALTAYADGNELVSTTDSTHSTGQHCGVRQNRAKSATTSQPFFDNFAGDTLGAGAQDITPAATTVEATPGTLSLSIDVEPAAVTIEAAAGTLTVSTDATDITPAAVTIEATPGTATLTTGAVDITPDAVTIDVTPGTLTLDLDVALAGPTIDATPGTLTVAAGAADITPDAVTVGITPGTVTISGGEPIVTPNERTFTVDAEDRTFSVPAEDRTFTVDAETRKLVVT